MEEEIASRYYYDKGRIQTEIALDKEVQRGIELLNNPAKYDSILTTITPSTRPFHNPAMNTWPAKDAK